MDSSLSLKINIPEKNVIKTMQFDPSTLVYEACHQITDKIAELSQGLGSAKDYGLFLADEDPKKGVWLEAGRSLEYYLLRNGDVLEYKKKMRTLRIRMLDGTVKTVFIDESQPVSNLMVVICTKIGITDSDEFSLVRELPEDLRNGTYSSGTMSLRRRDKDRTLQRIDSKMEQLKKKLKTDDDLDWVDHSKTLREQGIDEDETLLLRRKFFFSDHNVDSRDPVQLNLLYVQARNAIIEGSHPVTVDEAAQFAGLQCQIQFGDFVESKHKPGFLDLREFLPKDYIKVKGIEKRINTEHRRQVGLTELEAKWRYVQQARSLKTYGVTFFLVKEKMKGKNKLVPRLLGVTKESVLRLDEKTKEIVKTWPLTTVKRWAASPNSFTLDFGDYSDSYYSVQTTEGEHISQLIAGYIDIILKRKKAKDHFGIEGDEGSAMVEDSVSPFKATILQHQTAPKSRIPEAASIAVPSIVKPVEPQPIEKQHISISQTTSIKRQVNVGMTPKVGPSYPQVSSHLTEPQRALISNIEKGRDAIESARRNLEAFAPELPGPKRQVTFDLKKKALNAQLSATSAATAHLIQLTSVPEEEFDYPALSNAIQTVTFNLPEIAKDVKVVASLMEDESKGDDLIDATRKLCAAFSDLLNAAEPGKGVPRQSLLNAASRVGEATHALLAGIKDPVEYDHETEDILLSLAKGVANAAASLVLKAKDVAAQCEDPEVQNRVINAATQCALATSQLVATAKVVAPTIENPICQRQMTQASKDVAKAVENIVKVTQESVTDPILIGDLKAAAAEVARALNELLSHVRSVGDRRGTQTYEREERAVDTIYSATDRIFGSQGDPNEMIRQAKILAKATVQLINDLKGQAEAIPDSDQQKRLIVAARLLADATARLVDAAKGCKSYPTEAQYHSAIKHAAEDLHIATDTASVETIQTITERRVEPTYEEIKPLKADVQVNASETTFSTKITKLEQMSAFSEINEQRSSEKEVTVIRGSPEILERHSSFANGPQEIHDRHGPGGISPSPTHLQIEQRDEKSLSTEELERNAYVLQELQSRAKGSQACISAASTVTGIISDLETTMMFATAGTLNPENEHETFADHRENIFKTAKALVEDTKTLVAGAASSQEQLAFAAHNACSTMVRLADVVKQGAASLGSSNCEAQVLLINAVKDVATALGELIHATKNAAGKSVNDPAMTHLKEAAKVMIVNATSLLKTVRTVEDEQQRGTLALESAIEAIGQELRNYDSPEIPSRKSSPEDLVRVTKPVTIATAKAVAAGTSAKQDDIIVAANMGRKAIFDVLTVAKQAACSSESSYELRSKILETGRNCAINYRQLLQMVHQYVQRPTGATADEKQQLMNMSRIIATAVTEIVTCAEQMKGNDGWIDPEDPTAMAETELLGAASSIDAAAKKLESLIPRSTSVKVPDEDMNFDELILDAARSIAAATAALVRAASVAQRELISTGRMSARSPYSSDDGQWSHGLISAARHVAAATHSLVEAANSLVQGQASEERLISAAKQVASSTAQLLVACKVKADSTSQGMRRLQAAGNAVKKATENLVRAAQQAIDHEEEQSIVLSRRRVSGIAQEISFREAILKKERELAEAREKLAAVRRAKYKKQGLNQQQSQNYDQYQSLSQS